MFFPEPEILMTPNKKTIFIWKSG